MGYWGYEPKDGDTAWDFVGEFDRASHPELRRLFKKHPRTTYDRWDRIGFVQLLLERGVRIPEDIFTLVLEYLEEVTLDVDWVTTWREPKDFRKTLRRMRLAFHKINNGGMVMAPRGWPGKTVGSWTGLGEKLYRTGHKKRTRRRKARRR